MSTTNKKKSSTKKTAKKKATVKKAAVNKTVTKKAAAKKKAVKKKSTSVKKAATKKVSKKRNKPSSLNITAEERWKMIAVAAYHKAEKRNFAPGNELGDWAEAEKEIEKLLNG